MSTLIKRLQMEVWVRTQINDIGEADFYALLAQVLEKLQVEKSRV
jgi:hypothetical protein